MSRCCSKQLAPERMKPLDLSVGTCPNHLETHRTRSLLPKWVAHICMSGISDFHHLRTPDANALCSEEGEKITSRILSLKSHRKGGKRDIQVSRGFFRAWACYSKRRLSFTIISAIWAASGVHTARWSPVSPSGSTSSLICSRISSGEDVLSLSPASHTLASASWLFNWRWFMKLGSVVARSKNLPWLSEAKLFSGQQSRLSSPRVWTIPGLGRGRWRGAQQAPGCLQTNAPHRPVGLQAPAPHQDPCRPAAPAPDSPTGRQDQCPMFFMDKVACGQLTFAFGSVEPRPRPPQQAPLRFHRCF